MSLLVPGGSKAGLASSPWKGRVDPGTGRTRELPSQTRGSRFFPTCGNPHCRGAQFLPWRNREKPIVEGQWACSPKCAEELLRNAVARELNGFSDHRRIHRPRIPLGLLVAEQGWISPDQLRKAIEIQRQGRERLGALLIQQRALNENQLARGLGLQWSCPVLDSADTNLESMACVFPRLFVDAYGALPLKMSGSRMLYLAFETSPDQSIAFALGRMLGVRAECGFLTDSGYRTARARLLDCSFPPATLVEAATAASAVRALVRTIESRQPAASQLVRVRDFLWLRLWFRRPAGPIARIDEVEDLVCSIRP